MLELKQQITTYCVAKILLLSDRASSTESLKLNDFTLTSLPQFSSEKQTFDLNTKVLDLIIQFLKDSSRSDKPLKEVHY